MNLSANAIVGIVGSGAMGSGIAQIAATAGHNVIVFDVNTTALKNASSKLQATLNKLQEKGKISNGNEIYEKITWANEMTVFSDCDLIIEAIVENLDVKKKVFQELETITKPECILASNTSSLSITSIAARSEEHTSELQSR